MLCVRLVDFNVDFPLSHSTPPKGPEPVPDSRSRRRPNHFAGPKSGLARINCGPLCLHQTNNLLFEASRANRLLRATALVLLSSLLALVQQ